MVDMTQLKKILFLKSLPDEMVAKLGEIAETRECGEEEILFYQNNNLENFCMLAAGRVFLNTRAYSGEALTMDEVLPGHSFGVSALMDDDSVSSFTAICAEPSTIITLSSKKVIELCRRESELGYTVMRRAVKLLKFRQEMHTKQFLYSLAQHPDIREA
ncbi:MAG TPA: cyclic nucleotide-binding domain-containing protein [Desulfobacteraceae bacterium]|nr:cyclic nucleotide-binding domain-containing protein [Desulfobacteraceae bacterium]